jgi:large conductance mechanosensitive channel
VADRDDRLTGLENDMSGFKKFLLRGNLIDLAVAVVIGVAFNAIVQALVSDMITPLIGIFTQHAGNFATAKFTVNGSVFGYGAVINALISFLVIAAVVYYLIVAPANRLTTIANRNKAASDRPCPECLSQIPVAARRCMYCTSEVPPVSAPATEVPSPRRARHGYFAAE